MHWYFTTISPQLPEDVNKQLQNCLEFCAECFQLSHGINSLEVILPLEVMAVELCWDAQDSVIDGCHFP